MNKILANMNVQEKLQDQFSRTISYLRLSLTDRCNLRCMYCMPNNDENTSTHLKTDKILPSDELLSYEELLRIVSIAVSMGMNKLRLTGGEPLIRKGVMDFIENLSMLDGLEQIRLTTNGVLLRDHAASLYKLGVRHLNVSLDTMQKKKFFQITGKDFFERVWEGIHIAKDLGFKIKLNVVAMRGINDEEFLDFGKFALREPIQVRFIEFMPVGEKSSWNKEQFIPGTEIQEVLAELGELHSLERDGIQGPARMFLVKDSKGRMGRVGFISPISHHFCDQCNRLRLTSEGKLRSCLLHDRETDIKKIIRGKCTDKELEDAIREAILNKPQGHTLNDGPAGERNTSCQGQMSRIGG